MSHQWSRVVVRLVSAIGLVQFSPSAFAQIRPEPDAIRLAPPEVIDRLRADPIAYFRFVNRPWIARVCDMFADEIRDVPIVRLHGDAHVEQFTVTTEAWGLDDFDDSVEGPAVIDIVRFLGSVDLVARQRGWTVNCDSLFDRFFTGYRKGLTEPEFQPSRPLIVNRLRAATQRSRPEFLNWGDILMMPMADGPMKPSSVGSGPSRALCMQSNQTCRQATSPWSTPDGCAWESAAPPRRRFSSEFRAHQPHRMMTSSSKRSRFKA
jgi:hypothetical protein